MERQICVKLEPNAEGQSLEVSPIQGPTQINKITSSRSQMIVALKHRNQERTRGVLKEPDQVQLSTPEQVCRTSLPSPSQEVLPLSGFQIEQGRGQPVASREQEISVDSDDSQEINERAFEGVQPCKKKRTRELWKQERFISALFFPSKRQKLSYQQPQQLATPQPKAKFFENEPEERDCELLNELSYQTERMDISNSIITWQEQSKEDGPQITSDFSKGYQVQHHMADDLVCKKEEQSFNQEGHLNLFTFQGPEAEANGQMSVMSEPLELDVEVDRSLALSSCVREDSTDNRIEEYFKLRDKLPDLEEQTWMLSPLGFFEDTLENSVVLFEHINWGIGFGAHHLENLEVGPDGQSQELNYQLGKPRTALQYCNRAWQRHQYALQAVAVNRRNENIARFVNFKRKKQGLPAIKSELVERATYPQFLEDHIYVPTKRCSFEDYFTQCKDLLRKHSVTLRLQKEFVGEDYDVLTKRLADALRTNIQLPTRAPRAFKDLLRQLTAQMKAITIKRISNCALRALRRHLSIKISGQFPANFEALEGLPVTIKLMERVKVSFKLHFSEVYERSNNPLSSDLRDVRSKLDWLEDQMEDLSSFVQKNAQKLMLLGTKQKEALVQIEKYAAQGQTNYSLNTIRLKELFGEPQEVGALVGSDMKVEYTQ